MKKTLITVLSLVVSALLVFSMTGCNGSDNSRAAGSSKTGTVNTGNSTGSSKKTSYNHEGLVNYLKENGEYDAEYNEYAITYTTAKQYVFIEYDVEDDCINAGAMMLDDNSMGQLEFYGEDSSYETWYSANLDSGVMMMSGTVKAGKSDLKANYSKYVTIDWVNSDDEFYYEDDLGTSLSDTIKNLLATSTVNIVANVDTYILDDTGFSLEDIYDLPSE